MWLNNPNNANNRFWREESYLGWPGHATSAVGIPTYLPAPPQLLCTHAAGGVHSNTQQMLVRTRTFQYTGDATMKKWHKTPCPCGTYISVCHPVSRKSVMRFNFYPMGRGCCSELPPGDTLQKDLDQTGAMLPPEILSLRPSLCVTSNVQDRVRTTQPGALCLPCLHSAAKGLLKPQGRYASRP